VVVTSQKSWDMKINKIEITNFKGFQHESIQFHGNLTVVIGNNTAGKTTLLHAVQVGLGAYLQSLSDLPGGKPYRKNFVESDRFLKYNPNLKDFRKYILQSKKELITSRHLVDHGVEGGIGVATAALVFEMTFGTRYRNYSYLCSRQSRLFLFQT